MKNLLLSYLRLYPGKADVISNAIAEAKEDAKAEGLNDIESIALAERYILAEL